MDGGEPIKKSGVLRQVVTLLVAVGIFAVAAVVMVPKFQSRSTGSVKVVIHNGTGASMIEPSISLRVPPDQPLGQLRSVIPEGNLITVYDALGPIEVESIAFTAGEDGRSVTYQIDRTLEPDGVMILRVLPHDIVVDSTGPGTESP